MRTVSAGLAGLFLLGTVSTGFAHQMKGMEGVAQQAQVAATVEDQLRQLQEELKVLRKELAEIRAARGGQLPMGPDQMPMGAGMMGGPMGPMMLQMMQPTMQMMEARRHMMPGMMGQMGGMGGMAPQAKTQPPTGREPTEHGAKQADGLEVTLLSAPPLTVAEMQGMMPGMGRMQGMQGMGGMRGMGSGPGMGAMEGMQDQPSHWIGVIVRDTKADEVIQNLEITLTAQKGGMTRTVKLMPMPGSYGANINLPEKGRYRVTVSIDRAGRPLPVVFEFDNK